MSNHGLTADNMMQQFPIALQKDPKTVALGQAIAKVMESRQDEIDSLRIYTRIDELPEWLLDILARDFAVDWYDRSYTLEEKRKTIKDSFYVHRHRGTKAAVERAISAIYPNPKVLEWFEYGGDPYHFKLRITVDFAAINEAKHQQVLKKIICYKNLRSHLDSVIYYTETESKACYVAAIPCATTMSYTVLMPGVIEPRAVSAHACAAGAVSTTRMKTTIALPGTIHAKAVSAQALASGRPAQTYETVTIKLGGKSL